MTLEDFGKVSQSILFSNATGDAHLEYEGKVLAGAAFDTFAAKALRAHTEIRPATGLTVIAETKIKGRWYYWPVRNYGENAEFARQMMQGKSPLMDDTRKLMIFARRLSFYNLEREAENLTSPLAKCYHPLGGGVELEKFDGTINEFAGLMHEMNSLHLGCTYSMRIVDFFGRVPIRKDAEATRSKNMPNVSILQKEADEERRAELIRAFNRNYY
ncbi:hypothetical protein IJJ39_01340 [Candidatus Saccharibacteria bacterium]|nr:hypothetical protein [Candidatus Saccharibacteria bacterium]